MKKKTSKKALVMSFISLMLCFAMLVGTTFAWFTDTVSSGINRIQAGNLDVDLVMYKDGKYESIGKQDPNEDGDIFKLADHALNSNATLWEPGKTQYVYLGVQNKGNLALKYKIVLDVTDDYNGDGKGLAHASKDGSLASALEYVLIDGAKYDAALDAQIKEGKWEGLKAYEGAKNDIVLPGRYNAADNGVLDEIAKGTPNETDYFLLAVHMKEEAGNEYQDGDVVINVNIVATQKDAEDDSFGPDYDETATLPNVPEYIKGEGKSNGLKMQGDTLMDGNSAASNEVYVKIDTPKPEEEPSGEALGTVGTAKVPVAAAKKLLEDSFIEGFSPAPEPEDDQEVNKEDVLVLTLNVDTKSASTTTMALDVSMTGEATRTITIKQGGEVLEEKKETKSEPVTELEAPIQVELNLTPNLENVTVTHKHGNEPAVPMGKVEKLEDLADGKFYYDKATGKLTIMTSKLSEFVIGYVENEVCKIGSKPYSTLDAAVAEAKEGDVIVLTKDITAATISKNAVIDFNGKTVTATVTDNVTLANKGTGSLAATVAAGKTLTVTEGTFEDFKISGEGTPNVIGGSFIEDPSAYVKDARYETTWYEELKVYKVESTTKTVWLYNSQNELVKCCADVATAVEVAATMGQACRVELQEDLTGNTAIHGISNLTLDLNDKTVTGNVTVYDSSNVDVKNGTVNGQIRIGEHQPTIVKWKAYDQVPLSGYHPLAPAKNIVLDDLVVNAGGKNAIYFTNIEDDLTRANPSNPCDQDLYGRYIYKTGYTTYEQSYYHKVDEVFTACSEKDSVTIKGGSYSSSVKIIGNMCDINGNWYADVLNVEGGVFTDDSLGRFVKAPYCMNCSSANVCSATQTVPESYAAKTLNNYYTYVGGADAAIEFALPGETVYINENCSAAKNLLKNQALTVVSETSGVEWTGATTDEAHYTIEKLINGNATTFFTKFDAVAAVYKTTNNQVAPSLTDANKVGEYATIADAFDAANKNGQNSMVILLKDYTGGDEAEFVYSSSTKHAGAYTSTSVRFDLNGHTWTYTGTNAALASTNTSGSSGKATYICDTSAGKTGKIYAENGCCYYKYNSASENTIFVGGTFESKNKQALYFDKISANGKAGIVYIKGGTYISEKNDVINLGWNHTTGKLDISGGIFSGVTGKKIIGGLNTISCVISGGTFNLDVSSSTNVTTKTTIASGMAAVDNGDGTWTVMAAK